MNLALRFKLALKMVNPFNLKENFKQLNGKEAIQVTLSSREQLNHDTYLLRFSLPDENKCLGTQIGQYISLQDQSFDPTISRYYVPISRIDDQGLFDIMVNTVQANKSFSHHLCNIKIGSQISAYGPFNSFLYHGFGKIEKSSVVKNYKYIGLIAEGTGLASFFQLIEGIATNGDCTHIGLIYIAETLDDLVLLEELQWYSEEKKLIVNFLLRQPHKLWPGLKGELSTFHLSHYLPPPSDDTLIMVCGRTDFKKNTQSLLAEIDHKNIYII